MQKFIRLLLVITIVPLALSQGYVEQKFDGWRNKLMQNPVGWPTNYSNTEYSGRIINTLKTGKGNGFTGLSKRSPTEDEAASMIKAIITHSLHNIEFGDKPFANFQKTYRTSATKHGKQLLRHLKSGKWKRYHLTVVDIYKKLSEHLWYNYLGYSSDDKAFVNLEHIDDLIDAYSSNMKKSGIKDPEQYLRLNAVKTLFRDVISENSGLLLDPEYLPGLKKHMERFKGQSDLSANLTASTGFDRIRYYYNTSAFEYDKLTAEKPKTTLGIRTSIVNTGSDIKQGYELIDTMLNDTRSADTDLSITLMKDFTEFIPSDMKRLLQVIKDFSEEKNKLNEILFDNLLYIVTQGLEAPLTKTQAHSRHDELSDTRLYKESTKHNAAWHAIKAALASQKLNTISKDINLANGEVSVEQRDLVNKIREHAVKAVGAFEHDQLRPLLEFALRNAELVRALDRTQANPNFLRDYLNPVLDVNLKHSKFTNRTATSIYKILGRKMTPATVWHISRLGAFVEGFHVTIEHPERVKIYGNNASAMKAMYEKYGDKENWPAHPIHKVRQVTYSRLREADQTSARDNGQKRFYKKPRAMTNILKTMEAEDETLLDNTTIQTNKHWYDMVRAKDGTYRNMIRQIYNWSKNLLKNTVVKGKTAGGKLIKFLSFSTSPDNNCGFYTNDLETLFKNMGNIRMLTLAQGNLDYIKKHRDDIFAHFREFTKVKKDKYKRSQHSSKNASKWTMFENLITKKEFIDWLYGEQGDVDVSAPDFEPQIKEDNFIDFLTPENLYDELVNESFSYSQPKSRKLPPEKRTKAGNAYWYSYAEGKELVLSWLLDYIPVAWHVTNASKHTVESFGFPVARGSTKQEKHLYASQNATHDMKMSRMHVNNILDIIRGLRAAAYDQGAKGMLNPQCHVSTFDSWFNP